MNTEETMQDILDFGDETEVGWELMNLVPMMTWTSTELAADQVQIARKCC